MSVTYTVFSDVNLVEAARRALDEWRELREECTDTYDSEIFRSLADEMERLALYVNDREQTHQAARNAAKEVTS